MLNQTQTEDDSSFIDDPAQSLVEDRGNESNEVAAGNWYCRVEIGIS